MAALLASLLVVGAFLPAQAAERAPQPGPFRNIHVIDFKGDIEGLMLAYVTRRVEAAQKDGADCIVLRIESPGGTVFHSKKIGDLLLALPESIHVVAWVPLEAISGAAFVSLACDEILMTPAASLGDSQPIVPGEDGTPKPVGEKAESPLRAWFRGYAEANGYPVALAEAMVSQRIEVLRLKSRKDGSIHYVRGEAYRQAADDAVLVDGLTKSDLVQDGPPVVPAGELLTMTGEQALLHGFVKRTFEGALPTTEEQVLGALKAPDARVTFTEMTFSEQASKWLLRVAGILSALVMLSLVMLLFQGPGLMTIVGGAALVLVVLINLTAEQLHGFPIFLVLLGVALLAAEVFLIPGFGVAGILGFVAMGVGFLFLASGSTLGDTGAIDSDRLLDFGLQFVATAIAGFALLLLMSRFVPRVGPAARMVLQPSGAPPESLEEPAEDLPALGSVGVARSRLRPAGTAEFDGRLVDVTSDGGFLAAGARVRVVAVEGARVTVEAAGGEA